MIVVDCMVGCVVCDEYFGVGFVWCGVVGVCDCYEYGCFVVCE